MSSAPRITVTPPILTSGVYITTKPFELPQDVVYKCVAIRSFGELTGRGIDVFETYYEEAGLALEEYEKDANIKASIITLVSVDGEVVYVPNTFIESYPGMAAIEYERKVIVLEMGMMPNTVDPTYLLPELKDVVKQGIGVESNPQVTSVPYTKPLSHEEHVQLEATRRNTIRNHTPLKEEVLTLRITVDALRFQNEELIKIIEDLTKKVAV